MMINPILDREIKTRMRTWRTPIILTVYLVLLAVIVGLFFLISSQSYGYGSSFDPKLSIYIYNVIICCQFAMLMFIVPAFTATSISGERERQTLDLLLCTEFSTWRIIVGKITSSLSFVFIMIISSLPFIGIVFLFGGVSIWDIIKVMLFFMISAIMVSSIGMFCSTHFKKNITSIIMTYLILFVLMGGTGITFGIISTVIAVVGDYHFIEDHIYTVILIAFAPNPGFGLLSFILGDISTVFYSLRNTVSSGIKIDPWMANVTFDVVFSALLLFFSKLKLSRVK